jgi:hypothetical protein
MYVHLLAADAFSSSSSSSSGAEHISFFFQKKNLAAPEAVLSLEVCINITGFLQQFAFNPH